jgi:tetratricopeptide (TPR) repeat protein
LRALLAAADCNLQQRTEEDSPAPRVAWLVPAALQARDKYDLSRRRIAVVHPDPGTADALAEALRARGAQVIVLSLGEAGLERAEALDPDVVLVQPDCYLPSSCEVVGALWEHAWLCWAPVCFVPGEILGSVGASAPDVRALALGIHALCADYDLSLRRAQRREPFELQLAQLGPVRTLRALLESQSSLRLKIESARLSCELDLGEGVVIGARASVERGKGREELLGIHAIKSFLASTGGHISVLPVAHPALTNVMAPLEVLLLADRRAPPLSESPPAPRNAPRAAPGRHQATLVGIAAPLLRARPDNDADAASARALATAGEPPPCDQAPTDDDSPTGAFNVSDLSAQLHDAPEVEATVQSARPSGAVAKARFPRQSAPLPAASLPPERSAPAVAAPPVRVPVPSTVRPATPQARWQAHRRRLASGLALAALLTGGIWAWPSAERAPRLVHPSAAESGLAARAAQPSPLAPALAEASAPEQPDLARPVAAQPDPDAVASARNEAVARASELVERANALRRRGKLQDALDVYQHSLAVLPDYPRALAGLTQLHLAQHDAAKALVSVKALLYVRKHFPDDKRLLGDVHLEAGRADEARAAWRDAAHQGSRLARARLRKYRRSPAHSSASRTSPAT